MKGRTKTSLLSSLGPWPHRTPPHLQKAEPTRRPTGTKSEAEHTPTDSTFFFLTCPKTLKYEPSSVIQLQTQIIHAFCCPRYLFPKKRDQTEKKKKKNWIRPYLPWSDTSHVMLSAHWHPNLSGIIQNPNSVFFCLLEGTKMVQPPAVTEASFYLAAVSLNTKKNRRRCSLLH